MVAKQRTRLRQCGTAGGPEKQLHAQVFFQPQQTAADDRLGDAQPERRRRNSTGIRDCYEGSQFLNLHDPIPFAPHSIGIFFAIGAGCSRALRCCTSIARR
jgi:hypothetical protein